MSNLRYFNQTGWTAVFSGTETVTGRMVRVEGWDPATGTALVVDRQRGALRAVTDYEDFSHLERADQVVAALPGGGWRAHWNDQGPGGTPLTEQVLSWLVTSAGRATAITVDAHGYVEDADSADLFLPPGEALAERPHPVPGPGRPALKGFPVSPDDGVTSRQALASFIRGLHAEFLERGHAWENATLDRFLEALASWIEDSDGWYRNHGKELPSQGDWTFMARALGAATVYE